MTTDPEDIAGMDMPCECDCGEWFDLNDGHTCWDCKKMFCPECVEIPHESQCPQCWGLDDKRLEREIESQEGLIEDADLEMIGDDAFFFDGDIGNK